MHCRRFTALGFLALLLSDAASAAASVDDASQERARDGARPIVIAHRGASGARPEHFFLVGVLVYSHR